MYRKGLSLCLMTLLLGCAAPQQQADDVESQRRCSEPRPELCTAQYAPVCAFVGNQQQRKQYSNACAACADPAVTGYVSGACADARPVVI